MFLGEIILKNDAEMYKAMYLKLFNTITDVVQCCSDEKSVEVLKQAQIEAEDIYITYYE